MTKRVAVGIGILASLSEFHMTTRHGWARGRRDSGAGTRNRDERVSSGKNKAPRPWRIHSRDDEMARFLDRPTERSAAELRGMERETIDKDRNC